MFSSMYTLAECMLLNLTRLHVIWVPRSTPSKIFRQKYVRIRNVKQEAAGFNVCINDERLKRVYTGGIMVRVRVRAPLAQVLK